MTKLINTEVMIHTYEIYNFNLNTKEVLFWLAFVVTDRKTYRNKQTKKKVQDELEKNDQRHSWLYFGDNPDHHI